MLVACTKFKFLNFPPKCMWINTWSCELFSCNAMIYLESIGQDKKFAKRVVSFGVLSQKLWHFEVPCILHDHLAISPQPFIINSWSWTFWKWERKIFNFHVGQNFIWSFLDDVILRRKPFHFWQFQITGHLLFLETFHLTSNSSLLMFAMSNETCMDMNEASLTISHLQIHDWMHSWLWLTF